MTPWQSKGARIASALIISLLSIACNRTQPAALPTDTALPVPTFTATLTLAPSVVDKQTPSSPTPVMEEKSLSAPESDAPELFIATESTLTFTITTTVTSPNAGASQDALALPPSVEAEEALLDPGELPDIFITEEPTPTPTPLALIDTTPVALVHSIATLSIITLTSELLPATTPTGILPSTEADALYHVQSGDTLIGIALRFQTSVEIIKAANHLIDDTIFPDQILTIPSNGFTFFVTSTPQSLETGAGNQELPTVAPLPETIVESGAVQLSVLKGDAIAYPASIATDRFTLHYAPGTIPDDHPALLADILTRALVHHEQMLQFSFAGRYDVYVAGTPFLPPDQSLRGHSYSANRYFVFLDDGSGYLDDLTYLAAHELTHMLVWLVYGRPTDPMLSEGAAVYVGMDFISGAKHMPISTFCSAYSQIEKLPRVSNNLTYKGHIRDLDNYYAAGCFVKYLIETYGSEKFGKLYPTNDYVGIYGKSLAQLDEEWHIAVAAMPIALSFDAVELTQMVDLLAIAHTNLFDTFSGAAQEMAHFRELNNIRMALIEGRLEEVKAYFAH